MDGKEVAVAVGAGVGVGSGGEVGVRVARKGTSGMEVGTASRACDGENCGGF